MSDLTKKCSTIMIATKGKTRVYQSVEEVPEAIREKLLETTRGMNSATILIADKGGRQEILKAMRQPRPDRYSRLLSGLTAHKKIPASTRAKWLVLLPIAGRIFLVSCLGYVLWVLAALR